jgi:hypothetical protein
MRIPKSVRISALIFLPVAVLWIWYMVAADYGYGAVSGTYVLRHDGEQSTLILKKDRSFQQVLSRQGKTESAQGRWRRVGEGGVVFSREFLKLTGQEVRADGEADGEVKKQCLGLFPSINFDPTPGGPTFHKRLFPW